MKEFIEKLIGRLEKQAEQYRRRGFEHEEKGYSAMADKYYGKQCSYLHSIEIVNQLAEEYNDDFCEWHKVKNGNAYKCNTHAEIHDSRVLDWCICPYCGKKIKIAPYKPKGE